MSLSLVISGNVHYETWYAEKSNLETLLWWNEIPKLSNSSVRITMVTTSQEIIMANVQRYLVIGK